MTLNEREIKILSLLLRYRYMNSGQIKRLFFAHQTDANMHRVLTKLKQLDFIERIKFPPTNRFRLGSLLYLMPRGAKCLANEWGVRVEDLGFRRITKPIQSINHFYHRKRMIDFWIQLDQELEDSPIELKYLVADFHKEPLGDAFIAKTAIETKDKTYTLIPDLCFILKSQVNNKERVFFVEVDTGKETIQGRFYASKAGSLLHKYLSYEKIMRDGGWRNGLDTQENAFIVLTVTETQTHLRNIIDKCRDKVKYPQLFWLTTHDDLLAQGLVFDPIWNSMEGGGKRQLIK